MKAEVAMKLSSDWSAFTTIGSVMPPRDPDEEEEEEDEDDEDEEQDRVDEPAVVQEPDEG